MKGEGVIGIACAFLVAGARSVLVTLWERDDQATMMFMKIFYQRLKEGNTANRLLFNNRSHPFVNLRSILREDTGLLFNFSEITSRLNLRCLMTSKNDSNKRFFFFSFVSIITSGILGLFYLSVTEQLR